jgi:predicted dehydrogenase
VLNIGVIGCGYWGPNLIRNFGVTKRSKVKVCADLDAGRLQHMQELYPSLQVTQDYHEILADPEVTAVAIATPVWTHHALAMDCLRARKHVFVEKPLASSSEQCVDMMSAAAERNLVLMVGHTFVYTAAVKKIRDYVSTGELGEILYINSTRVNLGVFQPDINVIWDLAPHDLSIINYILDARPERVAAHGRSFIRPGIEDVAFVDLEYPKGVIANIHVSWLDPCKIRRTTVVGSKKMLVYDDISSLEKIRVYDKGVTVPPHYDSFGEFKLSYRYGDMLVPKLDDQEPLKVECRHFLDCIDQHTRPRSAGEDGLAIIRALEAASESLRDSGRLVEIAYPALQA